MAPKIAPALTSATLLLALATPVVVGSARSPQSAATAVISGIVVDSTTGEALPDAIVFLESTPARPMATQPRQLTDEKGRFAFVNLPGDVTFTISATKFGYLEGGYGRDAMPTDPLRGISLKPGEWIANIKVSIARPGAISGVVRDESGEPVVGVIVRVLHRVRIQGRDDFIGGPAVRTDDRGMYRISNLLPGRYLLQVPSVQATVPTSAPLQPEGGGFAPRGGGLGPEVLDLMDGDDTQRLAIGRYAIPPPPVNGKRLAYPAIYFPAATTVAEATTITLKYGEDRTNADLTLIPVTSVRVSGIVEGPPESLRTLTLRLLPAGLENLGFGAETATALVAADGRFTFLNVPAGDYRIDAPVRVAELSLSQFGTSIGPRRILPGPPTTPVMGAMTSPIDLIPGMWLTTYNYRMGGDQYSGRATVSVGAADVQDVVVRMRGQARMSGRYVIDPDPSRPDAKPTDSIEVQLDPATGEVALGSSARPVRGGDAGRFSVVGIIPGQYWLRLRNASGFVVKSVAWNGHDYTNTPFDATTTPDFADVIVTITTAAPELAGIVRSTDDLKADQTMVIAFPVDPASWTNTGLWPTRMSVAAVSSANRYKFATLPEGEYLVAAISRSFTEVWRDPAFLERVARSASRVALRWSGKSTLDLAATVIR